MSNTRIIDDHNSAAKDAYKRMLREKKNGDGLYPSSPELHPSEAGRRHKPPESAVKPMAQTALPHPKQTAEWLMRATVGGTQQPPRSSKTLESMLNNCCVLMNIKQFDQSSSSNGTDQQNQLLRPPVPMRKNGSNSLLADQSTDKPRLSVNLDSKDLLVANKTHLATNKTPLAKHMGWEEIEKHNNQYKKNRSSSHSKRQGSDRAGQPEPLVVTKMADVSSEANYLKPPRSSGNKPERTEKVKKQGQLLTSFKDMIYMGPFKNFGRKKTQDKREDQFFDCSCNKDKKVMKIQWDSTSGCMRSVGWLRNKYNPNAAYEELKEFFLRKRAEKSPPAGIKEDIQKDVVRTFNTNKYLSQEASKRRLESLLECMAVVYKDTSYVQGMNFIAGTLLYHCDEYLSMGVIKILFEHLELKDMFLPKLPGLSRHVGIIDTLIFLDLKDVYDVLTKHSVSIEIFCTNWLMCLGLNIIPLEHSGQFLDYLLEYGWHYFYRVIIYYLKKLEGPILSAHTQEEVMLALKSSKASRGPDSGILWPDMLEEALYFTIDDNLIDKLNEKRTHKHYFKSCPKRCA